MLVTGTKERVEAATVTSFEITTDYALVKTIVTHPKIYPRISDDGSPTPELWEPHPGCTYLLVRDNEMAVGVFAFVPHNVICVEIHTCLLPLVWGPKAAEIAPKMLTWVWKNTSWERIITNVPDNNRAALRFSKLAGLVEYGYNPNSFKKSGKLYGQTLLGVSRCH